MIWTNLNTGVMDSYTVAENTNSYVVTGLSDIDNYNVIITAVGVCGMITNDPVIVYGECVSICETLKCQFTYIFLIVWIYIHMCHISAPMIYCDAFILQGSYVRIKNLPNEVYMCL